MYMCKCVLQQLRKEFGRRHVKVTMETNIVHIVISPPPTHPNNRMNVDGPDHNAGDM